MFLASWSIWASANENNNSTTAVAESNQVANVLLPEEQEDFDENHLIDGKFRKGFSSVTEAGVIHIGDKTFFTISETWGVRVNPYFFVGQGMHLNINNADRIDLSATVDMRTNFLKKDVSPFFSLGLGINKSRIPIMTNEDVMMSGNKFVLNVGTGVEFRISPKAGLLLNGGYKLLTNKNIQQHGGFVKVGYVF